MKNNILIKYIGVFVILIATFVLFLTMSSMISTKSIYKNVKESSDVLLKEGNRKNIFIPYRQEDMQFDNYTDALMINTAYSIDTETPLYSAFVARKNYIPNVTTNVYEESVGELKSSSKYKYHNEVGELRDLVENENAESFEYSRYWHGYLTVLRPLLVIFNLTQLRIILTIILIMLSIILVIVLSKKANIIVALIFLLGLWSVEYFYLGFSLQGIFVFLIAIISSIILTVRFRKMKYFGIFFFVIGMLTNFFDFLTVPIVTLGIPLTIYFVLLQKDNENISLKQKIVDIIKYAFLWGMGYGLTWFTKWVLVDLIYHKNMIKTAIGQVVYRSVGVEEIKFFNVISINYMYIKVTFVVSAVIVLTSVMLRIIKSEPNITKNLKFKEMLQRITSYLIIMCTPFVLYMFLRNHSYYHAFFTYRNLVLMVLGFNLSIEEIFRMFIRKE